AADGLDLLVSRLLVRGNRGHRDGRDQVCNPLRHRVSLRWILRRVRVSRLCPVHTRIRDRVLALGAHFFVPVRSCPLVESWRSKNWCLYGRKLRITGSVFAPAHGGPVVCGGKAV